MRICVLTAEIPTLKLNARPAPLYKSRIYEAFFFFFFEKKRTPFYIFPTSIVHSIPDMFIKSNEINKAKGFLVQ
jgi:hypothetical protein